MKYRKKPVEVEVTGQFYESNKPWPYGVHCETKWENGPALQWRGTKNIYYVITIHGQKTEVVDGDWIIEEPDGKHHYPCKPDIFEATYEKVD